ncbi:homoserine dehydrogenase [Ruania alkalisoli]|uniref:Homoserine dehydrogenase n=1 Tax=Ruania alkalisoli TaxID=2779775 RepID=A0A7M1STI6_9MICO|nr:homoserine dehydrogenase [Ruania alkalisoli]QOR70889.1 homoserine dehydrogenase [Ruania alkalisoli]
MNVPAHLDTPPVTRVALTGAAGGFGRTVLLALRTHPAQRPTVLCDLDLGALRSTMVSLGYADHELQECSAGESVRQAVAAGHIALVETIAHLDPAAYDVLIESTGVVGVSARAAVAAIDASRPVVLASKETESLFGRALARRARARGVVSTTGAGDQPANLLALLHWAQRLGLEVVAAGKSSEYDLVLDRATGRASVLDNATPASRLTDHWNLGEDIGATLAARRAAVGQLRLGAAADYCEIAVVANLSGRGVDVPGLHYPIVRYRELADVFRTRSDGGILSSSGVLDVFVLLREADEASFAGGEFIVVRCHDREVARMLEQKGHVVSRSHDHLCIGLPFHLMGLEIPGTIADVVAGVAAGEPSERRLAMVACAAADLPAGTAFTVTGHHHEIEGTRPELVSSHDAGPHLVPYYLLDGARLRHPVAAGAAIRYADVEGIDPLLLELAAEDRIADRSPAEGVS